MDEGSCWYRMAKERELRTLVDFAESVEGLAVDPAIVRGSVMVIGPGFNFPERLFLCTPESEFGELREGIRSICSCDPEFYVHPEANFDEPVHTYRFDEQYDARLGRVGFYPEDVQTVAAQISEGSFDVVMWFRSGDLRYQFSRVLHLVQGMLKQGGVFMGSGSFAGETEVVAAARDDGFKILDTARLPNPDGSGFKYVPNHIGFILVKSGGFFRRRGR